MYLQMFSFQYLGRWYEYSNYFALFQLFGDCVTADYSDVSQPHKTRIKVVNRSVNSLWVEEKPLLKIPKNCLNIWVGYFRKGTPNVAEGSATLGEPNNPHKPGKLIVRFDAQPAFTQSTETNYNIIDTDYTSYAIVYSCNSKLFLFKSELLWILTREKNPPSSVINRAMAIIRANGIDTRRLKKTRQTNCPAWKVCKVLLLLQGNQAENLVVVVKQRKRVP